MKHLLLFISKRFVAYCLLFACLLLTALPASAQKQSISGTVTDATTNMPLIGAAVVVKGTSVGTSTDANGAYTLKVKPADVLVCSYFGYIQQEIVVGNRTSANFALAEENKKIDEVVVVGYGTLKKTQLVGAVENISGKALEGRTNATITRSLQGQVPGLNIIQSDGKPNHSGSVSIRGNGVSYNSRKSMTDAAGKSNSLGAGSTGALVLIDGVEGDMTTVNPDDVENISVLKDAASSAVYGARGAYGVILITTKKAKGESVSVNYNGSFAVSRRTVIWEDNIVSDGYTWAQNFANFYQNDTRTPTSSGSFPTAINNKKDTFSPEYLAELGVRAANGYKDKYGLNGNGNYMYYGNTNWLSMFYKDYSTTQNHNLSISASSERIQYSLSGRYYDQGGIYKIGDEEFKSYNLRQKGSVKINKWLTIDNNTSIFKRKYHQPMMTSAGNTLRQIEHRGQPVYVPYNEDGTPTYWGVASGYEVFKRGNTYQENNKLDAITKTTLTAEAIKDVLKIEGDFTYKAIRSQQERVSEQFRVSEAPDAWTDYNTSSYKSDWRYVTDYLAANLVLTWTPKLGEKHDLNVIGGYNVEKTDYRNQYLNSTGLLYPSLPSFTLMDGFELGSAESGGYDKRYVGIFARANYTLLNRYIFEFAGRYDGASLFPSKSQWGFFPSGSIGWRVSEEPWMKWSRNWLDNFKIRANVGSAGNSNISPYYFLEKMSADKSGLLFDGKRGTVVGAASIVPDNLTWETVTTYDVGLDIDVLNNRLSFSGDYYQRNTTDAICQGPELPDLYGATTPYGNYGAFKTKGWEVALSWRDSFTLGGKPFKYSAKVSVWDSRTWVTKYYNNSGNILTFYEGKELGEIWGFRTDGYFLSNDEANNWAIDTFHKNGSNFRAYAGDLKFIDINGDGKIDTGKGTLDDHGDLDRIGNEAPRYNYGINLSANWNGIGLSMLIQGVGQRDWYPNCESGFFYGMYNRPYGYIMKSQLGDNVVNVDYSTQNWVVTNADKKPYWTRQVGYSANRNVGPLTWENDYYLQDASYFRIKNITVDYTFPKKLTQKIHIQNLKVYISADNIFTHSPMFKNTDMFDPEVIDNGDSDFGQDSGLSGIGQGYSYPMLKTVTIGLNVTF